MSATSSNDERSPKRLNGASVKHTTGDYSRLSSDQQHALDDIANIWTTRHADDITNCSYWMTDEIRKSILTGELSTDGVTPRDVYDKFYDIYLGLEEQQAAKENASVRDRWKWAVNIKDMCYNINARLKDSVDLLDDVDVEREEVVDKTTQLHKRCETMMREHNRLETTAESISSKLAVFDDVNKITRQMSFLSSSTTDDVSKLFPPGTDLAEGLKDLFGRIDNITTFMEEHYDYQMASACLSQMSHLRSRASFSVRSHLIRLLDEAAAEILTTGNDKDVSSSLYEGFQAARTSEVRPIVDVLCGIAGENDDYVTTIYAVHQYYCTVRQNPVADWVNTVLDRMSASEGRMEDTPAGVDGNTSTDDDTEESDIIPYTRHVCRQVLSLATKECQTYTAYFGNGDYGTAAGRGGKSAANVTQSGGVVAGADEPIEEFLGNCYGKPLYGYLRSKIVSCHKVETLKSLVELISREILAPAGFDVYQGGKSKMSTPEENSVENPLLVPVLSVVYRLLKDVQERLIYRTQTYIRDDIRGFEPTNDDLNYPLRLFEDQPSMTHPEDEAYSRLMRVTTRGWYPTMGRTLLILAEILPVLETSTFQSLAHEAVSACLETIDIAAVDIGRMAAQSDEDKNTHRDWATLNETLFTIRHLLILREQIASFEVDLISSSQYLDFSNVKDSLMDVLSLRLPGHHNPAERSDESSSSSALNVPSRILSTFTPVIQSRQSDVKRDIEAQLKSACDRLIAHVTARLTTPLAVYVAKPSSTDETQSVDPNEVDAAWTSMMDKVQAEVPVIAAMMRAYLTISEPSTGQEESIPSASEGSGSSQNVSHTATTSDSTPAILFQPIHVRVVDVSRELERNSLHKLQKKYELPKHPASSINASVMEKSLSSNLASLSPLTDHSRDNLVVTGAGASMMQRKDRSGDDSDPKIAGRVPHPGTSATIMEKPYNLSKDGSSSDSSAEPEGEGGISEGPPLLRFVEEMSALESNYHKLSLRVEELLSHLHQRDQALQQAYNLLDMSGLSSPNTRTDTPGMSASFFQWTTGLDGFAIGDILLVVVCIMVASMAYLLYKVNDDTRRSSVEETAVQPQSRSDMKSEIGKKRSETLINDILLIIQKAASSKLDLVDTEAEAERLNHCSNLSETTSDIYEGFREAAVTHAKGRGLLISGEINSLWLREASGGTPISGAVLDAISRLKRFYCFIREKPVCQLTHSLMRGILAKSANDKNGDDLRVLVSCVCESIIILAHRECETYRCFFMVDTGPKTCTRFCDEDLPFLDMMRTNYGDVILSALKDKITECSNIGILNSICTMLSDAVRDEPSATGIPTKLSEGDGGVEGPLGADSLDKRRTSLSKLVPGSDDIPSEALMRPVAAALMELLDVTQGELDLSIQSFITDIILAYTPTFKDLDYPALILDTKSIEETSSIAPLLMRTAGCYPTVMRTITFLVEIAPIVELSEYRFLAKEAIDACIQTIINVASKVQSQYAVHKSDAEEYYHLEDDLHGKLFLLRQLILLRDNVTLEDLKCSISNAVISKLQYNNDMLDHDVSEEREILFLLGDLVSVGGELQSRNEMEVHIYLAKVIAMLRLYLEIHPSNDYVNNTISVNPTSGQSQWEDLNFTNLSVSVEMDVNDTTPSPTVSVEDDHPFENILPICSTRGIPRKDWSYLEDEEAWRKYWKTPVTDTMCKPWAVLSVCTVGPNDDLITPSMVEHARVFITSPPSFDRSPLSPSAGAEPVPCSSGTCDYMQRKDRLFIRGVPYTSAQTRTLVDHASLSGGAKLLGAADGLAHPNAVLNVDDGKYMMCHCNLRKKWITFALDEETYVEKIALDTKEYFSSTFRHLQILGSRKYPTDTWRVLGEIETDPTETQQWFDLSHTSKCAKCYVKYIKIRVLTSHTMEGYAMCTLTRVQIYGSTMIQSIGKLQRRYEVQKHPATFVSAERMELATEQNLMALKDCSHINSNGTNISSQYDDYKFPAHAQTGREQSGKVKPRPWKIGNTSLTIDDMERSDNNTVDNTAEGPPLLRFIEEMTELEANYHNLATNVNTILSGLKNYEQDILEMKSSRHSVGDVEHTDGTFVHLAGLDPNSIIKLLMVLVGMLCVSQMYLAYKVFTGSSVTTTKLISSLPIRTRKHRRRNRKRIAIPSPIPSDGFASA
ncbi:Golgi transport complex subunit 3 [Perkinsus chesapeaki]|uniref:Conserved oligomeric Golgi complex subunit 3 n=1 Tax=Perkinsus chesapeaki TaxID=330153 RepID=A0A7J6N2J8_PERCH|nr:Golgi transport complex subunit 3 [Perkinsus chesapeaki]